MVNSNVRVRNLLFYASAKLRLKCFFQSPDGKFWSPKSVRKIVASQRNAKLLKTFLRSKHNLTRERSQESDCHEKKVLNDRVAYIVVEKEFLLNR